MERFEKGLIAADPNGWIFDQDWFDSSLFYFDALDTVADSLRGRTTIPPLLQGSLTPKIDYARYEREAQEMAAAGLNDSQVEAVAQAHAHAAELLHLLNFHEIPHAIFDCIKINALRTEAWIVRPISAAAIMMDQ